MELKSDDEAYVDRIKLRPQSRLGDCMNLKAFIDKLDFEWNRMSMGVGYDYTFDCQFDISPDEFIGFAKMDIAQGDKHGLVNAMSNAKRAIECQADVTLDSLAGVELKRRNLPHKLQLLQEMGVVAPRILERVNSLRNLLEHEYELPEKAKAEEAVDIAELFVAACLKPLRAFPETMYIATEEEYQKWKGPVPLNCLYIWFQLGERFFIVKCFRDGSVAGEVIVTPRDWQEFCAVMRLAISAHPYRGQREPVQTFLRSLRNMS